MAAELLKKANDKPYADMRAAAAAQAEHERKGIITKPVECEGGGYALEVIQRRRPKRVPLGLRNVLTAAPEEGYEQRFVNDGPRHEGRIDMYLEAGWEVVQGGKAGDEYVGSTKLPGGAVTKPAGGGKTAVLLKKRKDWFDEDYAAKQAQISEAERGLIRKAQVDHLHPAMGYEQGIKISGQN